MNNEEKNILSESESVEEKEIAVEAEEVSTETVEEGKKKLSKNAIIGIAAGAVAVIVAVVILLVTLLGGKTPDPNPDPEPDPSPICSHKSTTDGKCDDCDAVFPITIAEAIEICKVNSNPTTERYYILATVKTLSNPTYGEMIIEDETGELYVYGTYSADGALKFNQMEETPVKGDTVLLHCTLNNYNGENQVKNARLIEFQHKEADAGDLTAYEEMTIAEARDAEKGKLVRVSGVVARITYANGKVPSGVILVDSTSSIYVYDGDLAGQVKIGNTVEIAAAKTYWILGTEEANAAKFGYKGANQLEDAIIISNDKGNTAFDKSWVSESSVKEILETPVTEDITNKIFKVNALVKKAPGNGFVNYYFNDIDGETGSYTYTQCNGSDFDWLDEFDGKICTVYLVAINAKSTATGCLYRFLPVEVIDEGYEFDTAKAAEYAVIYHALDQFLAKYTGNPELELVTSVSSELLGFNGATLSYASSDESVISFTEEDGKIIMNCGDNGTVTVTITGSYNGTTYSKDLEITVLDPAKIDYISVAEAILADVDSTVTVRGIVGPSVVNKNGFYLFGEDGSVISVIVNDLTQFAGLEIGHEVILTGMRERYVKDDSYETRGQTCIVDAEIIANLYGNHEYSTEKFITDSSVEEFYELDKTVDYSTSVYVLTVRIEYTSNQYSSNYSLYSTESSTYISLYCSSAGQYSFLQQFEGQTVTVEIAPCNWNSKNYWRGCILAVRTEDGKVYNTLNFDNN